MIQLKNINRADLKNTIPATPTFVHHSLMTNESGKTKPLAFYLKKLQ